MRHNVDIAIEQQKWGLVFVLVGPPGVGKNALMNTVLTRVSTLRQLPTATTRPIRPTEQQGREHLFVNRQQFEHMIEQKELIEHQTVHGELYGVPRATVLEALVNGEDIIADIDVLGATELKENYPNNVVLVFIQPPSVDELRRRMQTRGETVEEIEKRMQRVSMEMAYAVKCDYLIVNDLMEQASETLYGIVLAERSHREVLKLKQASEQPVMG